MTTDPSLARDALKEAEDHMQKSVHALELDLRAVRTGRRPDGRQLDEFMPWKVFAGMTDAEVHALWRYLQSVPSKEFGNK